MRIWMKQVEFSVTTEDLKVGALGNLWKCRKVTGYGNYFGYRKGDRFRENTILGFRPLGQSSIALRGSFEALKPLNTLRGLTNAGRARLSGFEGDSLRVTR